jgi:hypothetical protein
MLELPGTAASLQAGHPSRWFPTPRTPAVKGDRSYVSGSNIVESTHVAPPLTRSRHFTTISTILKTPLAGEGQGLSRSLPPRGGATFSPASYSRVLGTARPSVTCIVAGQHSVQGSSAHDPWVMGSSPTRPTGSTPHDLVGRNRPASRRATRLHGRQAAPTVPGLTSPLRSSRAQCRRRRRRAAS